MSAAAADKVLRAGSVELVDIAALATLYRVYTRALGRAYGGIAARPDFIAALANSITEGKRSRWRCRRARLRAAHARPVRS
jgi:hypothetical protein